MRIDMPCMVHFETKHNGHLPTTRPSYAYICVLHKLPSCLWLQVKATLTQWPTQHLHAMLVSAPSLTLTELSLSQLSRKTQVSHVLIRSKIKTWNLSPWKFIENLLFMISILSYFWSFGRRLHMHLPSLVDLWCSSVVLPSHAPVTICAPNGLTVTYTSQTTAAVICAPGEEKWEHVWICRSTLMERQMLMVPSSLGPPDFKVTS